MNTLYRDFLDGVDNLSNFRILLALALEATRGSAHPIFELGPSDLSTPHLHAYCESEGRAIISVEEDLMRALPFRRFSSDRHELRVAAWSAFPIEAGLWSVALLKHAPGERRRFDALRLADRCEILVLHDTEPAADYGYNRSEIWGEFRSRVDVRSDGAWATAVSKTRDLSGWRGLRFGKYAVTLPGDDLSDEDPTVRGL